MAKDDDKKSPWLKGVAGVKGVVPPGRRLGKPGERRSTRWSATGVNGVVPPGSQKPGQGPSADWAKRRAKDKKLAEKKNKRAFDASQRAADNPKPTAKSARRPEVEFDALRPMAGFEPDVFADLQDPDSLKAFLQCINEFLAENRADPLAAEHFSQMVNQSHAPFEIVIAFTILSSLVGRSTELRRRFSMSLERGAKVFFNLAGRLNHDVKAPRGLVPETVDALFYDLPATAYQFPYAFATSALMEQLALLRKQDNEDYDRLLIELAERMQARFIEGRSFGDQSLASLFPWDLPEWAPPPE